MFWKKPVTAAAVQAEAEKLERDESSLKAKAQVLSAEIEQLDTSAGEQYLAGSGPDTIRRLLECRTELELVRKALSVLRERHQQLQASSARLEAEELRREAQAKRRELADLQAQTRKHLAALSELEEIEYGNFILNAMPAKRLKPIGRKSPEFMSPADIGWNSLEPMQYLPPKSLRLANEVMALEKRAAAMDPADGGPAAA
jgi:hypothetical protein